MSHSRARPESTPVLAAFRWLTLDRIPTARSSLSALPTPLGSMESTLCLERWSLVTLCSRRLSLWARPLVLPRPRLSSLTVANSKWTNLTVSICKQVETTYYIAFKYLYIFKNAHYRRPCTQGTAITQLCNDSSHTTIQDLYLVLGVAVFGSFLFHFLENVVTRKHSTKYNVRSIKPRCGRRALVFIVSLFGG